MSPPSLPSISAEIAPVAREFGLDLVVLFGSLASGKARGDSDADVAVRGARALSFDARLQLAARLEEIFERTVDVIDLRRADPLLLHQIFLTPVVLHDAGGAFAEARLFAFHRYEDYRPMLLLERRAVRRALGMTDGD
jgi:predicted nucleotidyltransferase